MKIMIKLLGSIFALGLIILVGLHIVMQYGLTKAMRDVVLPRVQEETGIDAKVGRLSINMASGLLYLKDVEVRNPEGFLLENLASVERIEVEVDILSLFKQKLIQVKNIEVENGLLNVIRNQVGDLNISKLQEGLQQPVPPSTGQEPAPEVGKPSPQPRPEKSVPVEKQKPIQELVIEAISANAKLRYIDFKLNELDIALDLQLRGQGVSTQRDPNTPWGNVAVTGSLGDDRTSFITDLKLRLAPVTDPQAPSFDLSGKIMEIDPRIMEEAYDKLRIRSAPFGIDPQFHCRKGWYENSGLSLTLRDIVLKDKLAKKLGGMSSIGTLRFTVPVEGSLQEPEIDVQSALLGAVGNNAGTLLDSLLKGAAAKEAGLEEPPATLEEAAVEILAAEVDEIGESETAKKILKDLADGEPSATNAPDPVSSDTIVDILAEQVDEIGEDKELQEDLKNLGKWLFGK